MPVFEVSIFGTLVFDVLCKTLTLQFGLAQLRVPSFHLGDVPLLNPFQSLAPLLLCLERRALVLLARVVVRLNGEVRVLRFRVLSLRFKV